MKKRLIYIAGEAHSGSTATDFLLGRFVGRSCGQVAELGDQLDPSGNLTADALARDDLGFWLDFLKQASPRDRLDYRWLSQRIRNERNVLAYMLSPSARRRFASRFDRSICPVFTACGVETIIDSSKNSTRALGMLGSEICDVYVVHLVRRPSDFLVSLMTRGQADTALRQLFWMGHWIAKNALASIVGRYYGGRYFLLRYDVLYTQPYAALVPLFGALGLDIAEGRFKSVLAEVRPPPETVGGNRIRQQGPIRLEMKTVTNDDLARLSPVARALCWLVERVSMP